MPFQRDLEDLEHRIRDRQSRGVLVRGSFGVGKSELLAALVRAERERGSTVLEAAGTASAGTVRFGALAHLIPGLDPSEEPLEILHRGHLLLREHHGDRRLVLVVDDAYLLDEWSAAFLFQAAVANTAFVVATIRRSSPLPQAIAAMADRHGFSVLEMSAFSETESAKFIRSVLKGPVEAFAMTELIRLSGGNPDWIRRLITDAQGRGTLGMVNGVWQRTGPLVDPGTARAIASDFLTPLSEAEVEILDLLAIADTLSFSTLEALVDLETLEALERTGFVHVDPVCPASTTSLASDSVRELLVARMPATRRIRLSRRLASAVPRPDETADALARPPAWLVDTDHLDDPAECERGARLALADGDFKTAERFAAAALRLGSGETGKVLRAEALLGLGRADEASSILVDVLTSASEDAHIAQAALAQMRHARLLVGNPADAALIGEQALEKLESAEWKDEIGAALSLHAGLAGDYTNSAAYGSAVLERPGVSGRAVVEAAISASQAQVMLGRLDAAAASIERGAALAPALAGQLPTATELLDFSQFQVHLWDGDLDAADTFTSASLTNAMSRRVPGWVGLWTFSGAAVKLFQGRVVESARGFCEALGHLASFDPLRVAPTGRAWQALAEAQAGMLRAADATLEDVDPEYLPGEFRVNALRRGVEAWLVAQVGDEDYAAKISREVGIELIDRDHVVWGGVFAHHAARFGHGDLVADTLEAVAASVDGRLLPAMAEHARASAERDPEMLDAASRAFERMGANLFAAETAAQAAALFDKRGAHKKAARSSARATNLGGLAQGADTPALRRLGSFLTPREQEIARMAMRKMTSREIAEKLSISIRTVDNHLGSVYAKLGVHGREELASAMSGRE